MTQRRFAVYYILVGGQLLLKTRFCVTSAVYAALLALALALVSRAHAQLPEDCQVPNVPGIDQSASDPTKYGVCTDKLDQHILEMGSNWCNFGQLGYWPAGPSPKAQQCMKFGRMTVYRGPIYGNSPSHKGACDIELVGSNETALVAVSTRYLKTSQHGWAEDKGACGHCMCVHVRGVDHLYNPGVKYYAAKDHFGLTFMAKVGDRCGECEDEHIDVLLDRPLAYAPYRPDNPKENKHARHANSWPGPRGFGNPWAMRGGDWSPETVGTWVADWNWVPCEGWNHQKCADMMRDVGYAQVFTPQNTVGVDSVSMRRVLKEIGPEPWSADRVPKPKVPTPTVSVGAMCGGMGDGCQKVNTTAQCEDVQWAHCPPGFTCIRDSQWWWSCLDKKV